MLSQSEDGEERPIHVLEIAGNAIVGGMEKYVYNLARHLPAQNIKVTCMTPYESAYTASLRQLGSEVYITAMDNDPAWRSIQFTTELIRHQKIDIVHAHLPKAHVLGGLAGRLTGIPVVATIHGMDINAFDLGVSRTVGSHLTVVCQDAYAQALALGVAVESLSLVTNGVDTKAFHPHRSSAAFRRALQIPEDAPLVGFVGRLAWEKGPDQFLRAAEYILQQRGDIHFVMVGDGPMTGEIRETIQRLNLSDRIHLAGVSTNTCEVYPAFDILAQTSRVEGMPFALLEAMSCGRPVIAMAVGGVAEIVEVGTTGLLSAPGDWAGLGEAVLKLVENPDQARLMGQASRKRVEERFDLQDTVRQIASLFYRLLGRKAPPDPRLSANLSMVKKEDEMIAVQAESVLTKGR